MEKNPQGALQIPPELKGAGEGRVQKAVSPEAPRPWIGHTLPHPFPPQLPQPCCPDPTLTRVTTLIPTLSKMKLPRIRRIESPRSWHFLRLVPEHTGALWWACSPMTGGSQDYLGPQAPTYSLGAKLF